MNNDPNMNQNRNVPHTPDQNSYQYPYQYPAQVRTNKTELVAPVTKSVVIGFLCGLASLILPFFSAIPFYMLYTDRGYTSPLLPLVFGFISVALAAVALIICVYNGNVNVRAGKYRGGLVVWGTVLSIIGLVISGLCFSCVGTISIYECSGGNFSSSSYNERDDSIRTSFGPYGEV